MASECASDLYSALKENKEFSGSKETGCHVSFRVIATSNTGTKNIFSFLFPPFPFLGQLLFLFLFVVCLMQCVKVTASLVGVIIVLTAAALIPSLFSLIPHVSGPQPCKDQMTGYPTRT